MKKIIYLKFIILLIFIFGCAGYDPIFSSTNLQFEIAQYSLKGDKQLANKFYSKLKNLSDPKKDKKDLKSVDLLIDVSKNKEATTKDSTGKILQYKITLITKVEVKDFITDDKILNKNFENSLSYKVQDQYFDTIQQEKKTIENLVNLIHQQLFTQLLENINLK